MIQQNFGWIEQPATSAAGSEARNGPYLGTKVVDWIQNLQFTMSKIIRMFLHWLYHVNGIFTPKSFEFFHLLFWKYWFSTLCFHYRRENSNIRNSYKKHKRVWNSNVDFNYTNQSYEHSDLFSLRENSQFSQKFRD